MKKQLLSIIKNEDKKNPLTDQQIADMLGVSRSKVTSARTSANIESSNNRRRRIVLRAIQNIVKSQKAHTERSIRDLLLEDGFEISRSQVRTILKDMESAEPIENNNIKPGDSSKELRVIGDTNDDKDGFESLIGADGSLKEKIASLKSAMMYPPNGLHTIIHGPTGVGKSDMAECMYRFSVRKGFKKKGSPFIVFNCADYAENPNLLISHLFGVQKGAYTGAHSSKEGLVERADGGILFLDEVHRLPSTGQEILFSLIDRGVYRRLGETTAERKAKVLIICATTGDPNSDLLITFKRRIPMIIDLPRLEDRPQKERYDLILKFFEVESRRVNKNFAIDKRVINKLMNYKCTGNIGQLKSDIQVTCARAFSKLGIEDDFVYVGEESLRSYVRKASDKQVFAWIDDVYIDISDLSRVAVGLHKNATSNINKFCIKDDKARENVKVLIVTHGRVGIEMSNVVNSIMGLECTVGLEIRLDTPSHEGIEKCISQIYDIQAPKGLIILIDMGSLVIMGNEIEKRYGIKTKTIARADTLLAMEIGKMAAIEGKSFDEISSYCDSINDQTSYDDSVEGLKEQKIKGKDKKNRVIVSLCLSGHGNAQNLKRLLTRSLDSRGLDIDIIPVGFLDEMGIEKKIEEIEKENRIICIVGTIDINYKDVPYINNRKIISGEGIDDLVKLCGKSDDEHRLAASQGKLSDIILEEFIYENFEGISKEYVIDSMVTRLQERGYVDSNFILSVYKRESMGNLVFKSKVAIPHGLPENVKKPVISIAKLTKPIVWDNDFMVDCVALIAIKENNQAEMKEFFKILSDDESILRIGMASSKRDIIDIFV